MSSASAKKRTAILISGRGSNMVSLIAAARQPRFPAEIVVVISNRPDAAGLQKAAAAGIDTVVVDHTRFASRVPFEMRLHQTLLDHGVELVCLAGFMRMLTGGFVDRWRDRLLNIHPSLLPAFPGLDVHERVLEQGVRITGCTVHQVRVEMDTGPIVAQAAVPVLDGDTPQTLAERVLAAEHMLYPHALSIIAGGAPRPTDAGTARAGGINQGQALFSPPLIRIIT